MIITGNDIFNSDERILVNNASRGITLAEFTRQRFLENLNLTLNIVDDSMIKSMVEGLKVKVSNLTDDAWNSLTVLLPLHTPYDSETNVDDVPEDMAG